MQLWFLEIHLKNVYGNIITKSVKNKKHVVVKHFSSANMIEIIIHVGINDLSKGKEPKGIANDIIQLAQSVRSDANKVAISFILPRKDKFNNNMKDVNTSPQYTCSANNLSLIIYSYINPHR